LTFAQKLQHFLCFLVGHPLFRHGFELFH
jgi:hypothetical protein